MAKHKRYSKKSSKCPEPFNTLIDIAAGITMNAVANKMEKKHGYHRRGVPNPYRASAFGFTTGRLNDTEDLLKLGGLMGAMGAFDDDSLPSDQHLDTSWEFDDLGETYSQSNDNRYAWRFNCEDGSDYGIYPEDYETRNDYNEALSEAKMIPVDETDAEVESSSSYQETSCETDELIFCRVSIIKTGENKYFLCDIQNVAIGSMVVVPIDDGEETGVVLSVEHHTRNTAPCDLELTQWILRVEK